MKIAFGLIFFQCKQELERLIKSLPSELTLYAIDGRLQGYPSVNALSTDGSRDVLKARKNTKLFDCPDVEQYVKRNRYLEEAAKDGVDVLILVDSDHWLIGNWKQFYDEIETVCNESNGYSYKMPIYTQGIDGVHRFTYLQCLFYRPEKIRYDGRHDTVFVNGVHQTPTKIVNYIMQINDKALRSQDRIAKGYIYKVFNRRVELGKTEKQILDTFKEIGW